MNFTLPLEITNIINDYSKPIGIRLDWKTNFPPHREAIIHSLEFNLYLGKYKMIEYLLLHDTYNYKEFWVHHYYLDINNLTFAREWANDKWSYSIQVINAGGLDQYLANGGVGKWFFKTPSIFDYNKILW